MIATYDPGPTAASPTRRPSTPQRRPTSRPPSRLTSDVRSAGGIGSSRDCRIASGAHRRRRARARRADALTMVVVLDGFLDAGNAAAIAARHLIDARRGDGAQTRAARWWRPSTSTSCTTTAPAGHRCRSCATTTRPTTRRGWWCGCCATPAARRTCCCTGRSPTPAGRASPPRSARWSSASASPAWSGWARCRWRCRTPGRSRSPTTPTTPTC